MIQSISTPLLSGIQRNLQTMEGVASRLSQAATIPRQESIVPANPDPAPGDVVGQEAGLEEDMVSLLLAKRFIQAQTGVIRTEDEMLAELINLGRRKTTQI